MKTVYSYFFLLWVCAIGTNTFAQSELVHTEYQTEAEQVSKADINRLIRYITRADVEEKTLIKLGGLPNSTTFSQTGNLFQAGLNAELAVERKLSPSFSFLVGFDNQLDYLRSNRNRSNSVQPAGTYWFLDQNVAVYSYAKAAIRFYYTMAKRIREGKSANNFSGSYIALQARRPVLNFHTTRYYDYGSGSTRTENTTTSLGLLSQPSLALQWGIQQRIGHRGYVDLNVGPEVTLLDPNTAYYQNNNRIQWSLRVSAINWPWLVRAYC